VPTRDSRKCTSKFRAETIAAHRHSAYEPRLRRSNLGGYLKANEKPFSDPPVQPADRSGRCAVRKKNKSRPTTATASVRVRMEQVVQPGGAVHPEIAVVGNQGIDRAA